MISKPIIVAVVGDALGGGCDLATAFDLINAADNAQFGHRVALLASMSADSPAERQHSSLPMPATQRPYCYAQFCRCLAN